MDEGLDRLNRGDDGGKGQKSVTLTEGARKRKKMYWGDRKGRGKMGKSV